MDFVSIENKAKKVLAKFPKTRRYLKGIYHRISYVLSKEKTKCEGNIVRISPNDEYEYFYGYYDKSPWDATDRYMIALQVKNANKVPDSTEEAKIVIFDTENNNEMKIIGTTHCWNTQQGCMAQWLGPDFKTKIIYNDYRNEKYVSVVYNIKSDIEEKIYDMPIYDVSKDGKTALTLDFSRLHRLRKGYGYANKKEETKKEKCPDKTCIWKINLKTGKISSVIKYTDLYKFETRDEMVNAEHKVNHIMISPNGKRFMVLHRWFKHKEKFTRLVTMNIDGTDMYNLSDDNFVSHCCWKNNKEILSFLRKKQTKDHYYLMKDKTKEYELFWKELNTDGHCTYSYNGKYIITDTYPNRKRKANVYLCEEGKYSKKIASVFAPFKYDNDVRCDLHPRWDHNNKKICIDSVHEGKKELYIISIEEKEQLDEIAKENHTVTVVIASYNGEKYISEQIESVLNQKGVKLNILIRDDGSTDKTKEILDKYQKKYSNIKWYTGSHLNVQKGFLDLLQESQETEYYAFCDQDDVWDEDKLLIAISKLQYLDNSKPALYYCGQRLVDSNLNFISNHYIDNKRSDYTNFLISNVAGCTAVFNKKLRDEINCVKPEFILMHDSWVFKVCLALGGTYYADREPHISYRQHNNNTIGLNKGIKSKIHQMKRYIYEFKIQQQVKELYKYYNMKMSTEYKEYSNDIINYNKNLKTKMLKKYKINFNNKALNITVKIKVLLNKL